MSVVLGRSRLDWRYLYKRSTDFSTDQVASGYRLMWLMVMFDLPVVDPSDRKAASDFRLELLDLGFEMSQFSVYLRFCSSQAQVETLSKRIENSLPAGGKVSLLQFTDKQYGRVVTYQRSTKQKKSEPPSQYLLL